MTDVRITQLDGKLPNLALMRLSAFHKARGDRVHFYRTPYRQLGEPGYSAVYGSAIFQDTARQVERFRSEFPGAIIGGTGSGSAVTVEEVVGECSAVDYGPWDTPAGNMVRDARGQFRKVQRFTASIGFTQRGCRLSCKFCVVPLKEGKPASVATIGDTWRGEGHARHLHLLDNDFFGQAEDQWRARIAEIRDGAFKVCFSQGVNVRAITDETAAALASVDYRDDQFKKRRLYTAWDNLKDEGVFFTGVDRLEAAGVLPSHLMVYMLIGFDKNETWARIFHRFNAMVGRGIKPFPMVYGDRRRTVPLGGLNARLERLTLANFQRWVNATLYRRGVDFAAYDAGARHDPLFKLQPDMFAEAAA